MTAEARAGDEDATDAIGGYGWVEGVFVPTLLTILGVILFLRTGWVVGNAGLGGGVVIIVTSYAITGSTALSIASIASNRQIGGGGAYAIIARSLGPEAGGAVGIPLYLSQTLVIVLYIFGFRDGWLRIFPDHPALLVDVGALAVIIGVALISAAFAFRVQYVILALIVAALGSMALGALLGGLPETPVVWGDFPGSPDDGFSGVGFWAVFAVFFPATTGIMAGANISGELADSRRAIPLGTLLAVGVSFVIYLATAAWLASATPPDELVRNYLVVVERSAWGPAVLAGLLGATFSSALASAVGAPRILHALAEHGLLPRSSWLAVRAGDGEPRHALYVTAGIALAATATRALNAIAPVITLFFLITYGTVNLVVLMEHVLDLPSFRPRLRLPTVVPLFGFVGSIIAMFIVNFLFSIVGVVVVLAILVVLIRRQLDAPFSDVRSELFQRLSRWAGDRAKATRESSERSWRPNLLVPVAVPDRIEPSLSLLHDMASPMGRLKLIGYGGDVSSEDISVTGRQLNDGQLDVSWSVVDADAIDGAIAAGTEVSGNAAAPNIACIQFPADGDAETRAHAALETSRAYDLGVVVVSVSHRGRVGGRGVVNLWISPQSHAFDPDHLEHSNLAVLLALKLVRNWAGGQLNLLTVVGDDHDAHDADSYLHEFIDAARLPGPPTVQVLTGVFGDALGRAPRAEANMFALGPDADFDWLARMVSAADTPCIFVRDSGNESAFV